MKLPGIDLDKLKNEGTASVTAMERRRFLKMGFAVTGVYLSGNMLSLISTLGEAKAAGSALPGQYPYSPHYAMVIRQSLCIDCRKCVVSCDETNNVPAKAYRTRILTKKYRSPHRGELVEFIPVLCNQCNDAPCVRACPTRATYKDPITGIVRMENKKCIGCKTCLLACPYDARFFNYDSRAVDKCDFCWEQRLSKGEEQTACSLSCPTSARTFGNLSDPDNIVFKLVHQIEEEVWVLRPETYAKPNVFYMKGNFLSVDNILKVSRFDD